jgi:hypothetical protein
MKTELSRRRLLALVPAVAAATVPTTATTLAGLAAAVPTPVAASPSPIPDMPADTPADNPDAELIKLVDEWFAAYEEGERLGKVFSSFEEKVFSLRRERERRSELAVPDAIRVRSSDVDLGIQKPSHGRGVYTLADVAEADLRSDRWFRVTKRGDDDDLVIRMWRVTPSPAARARADEIIQAFDKLDKKHDRKPRGYRAAEREFHSATDRSAEIEDRIQETPALTLAGLTAKARMVDHGDLRANEEMGYSLASDLLALNAVADDQGGNHA